MPRPATRSGCPICGAPTSAEHTPFCGQRCRDRDLLTWLGEGYRIPGEPAEPGLDSPGERD